MAVSREALLGLLKAAPSSSPAGGDPDPPSPREVLSELRARDLRRAWLVGGARLAASFRAEALITEYIVSVIPVILGGGIPLFDSPGPKESLELVGTRSYVNGVIQLRYARKEDASQRG